MYCLGKYDLVRRDYDEEIKVEPDTIEADVKMEPCELDEKIQDLLKMITDINMMENCVKEMKFDIQKAPLGKEFAKIVSQKYSFMEHNYNVSNYF